MEGIQPRIAPPFIVRANSLINSSSLFHCLPVCISSPVNIQVLAHFLQSHQDQVLVRFLVQGFTHGFNIGFEGSVSSSLPRNLLSARNSEDGVTSAIQTELQRGHTAGPFPVPPFNPFHCSPLGAVPKPDGSIRLILDLSSPRDNAINEGIPQDLYSVVYSHFDDAVDVVRVLGPSAYMGKIDIRHAFRLCPVRFEDFQLLGFSWLGSFFVELRLPFGSRSSPFIFNNFADAICWILIVHFCIQFVIHYLDDFFVANSDRHSCQADVDTILHAFGMLGIPVAVDKLVGPSQCITYLGIEIDSRELTIRLPQAKLIDLLSILRFWSDRKKCTKRELLSLIGKLSFASKVVKPGRLFLRRLIDLAASVERLNHHIYINKEAKADIQWWEKFLTSWNGVSIIQSNPTLAEDLVLATDACLHIGFGGTFGAHWFHGSWPPKFLDLGIAPKELFAILVAIHLWRNELVNKHIILYTDNIACSQVWVSGASKDPNMMRFLRPLFFMCASHNICLVLHHIPGHFNALADYLSRSQIQKFRDAHPRADLEPVTLPAEIWTY